MPKKANIDECAVIERYEECETARIVAQEFNVSTETIYRILERNGIQRTHRHQKKPRYKRDSNCRSKVCPALIVMLRTVSGMKSSDISRLMNCNLSTVSNVIARRGLQKDKPISASEIDMDTLEAEYLAGATTYELGEKYGVYHSTISKWMKQRGHVRGKCFTTQKGCNAGHDKLKQLAIERDKQRLLAEGGKIELVEYSGYKSTYRCTDCGLVFTRCRGYKRRVVCPDCFSREIAEQKAINDTKREEARKKSEQARAEEYAKDKICKSCGCVFHNESPGAKYCSGTCSRREKRHRDVEAGKTLLTSSGNHRKRARIYGVAYEPGITVKKLIKRDNNICQICGEPCDSSDNRWSEHFGPLYPTIDHIIAMVNGGGHTWDNVQLAHAICNSVKRDLTEEELTEEVITHAKEQAITDKCA